MNKKLLATTLIILLYAATATAQTGPSTNVQPTLINTDPVPLQSGESGDLRFKLENTGSTDAQNVEVQLLNNYPFEIKPDRQTSYELGELAQGQEYQISTEVLVAEDAPDGANNFKIRVLHGDLNKTVNVPVEVQSQDIELNLANLKTSPQQLMPDTEDNTLSVDVVNNGDKTAENTVLNLEMPDYFEQTSSFSTRQALGNIAPGQVKTAEFTFDLNETAPAGMTQIDGELSYSRDGSTGETTEEKGFQMQIQGKPQFQVETTENTLRQGTTQQLRIQVENIGDEQSASTRIRVLDSSDQPFTYDSSSQYIGTLEPGQTGEAVFQVETEQDATAKDYLIDFETRGVKDTEVFVEDTTITTTVQNGQKEGSNTLPVVIGLLVVVGVVGFIFRDRIKGLLNQED